jgi:hypothetical protein
MILRKLAHIYKTSISKYSRTPFTLLKGPSKNGVNCEKCLKYITNLRKLMGPEKNVANDGKM